MMFTTKAGTRDVYGETLAELGGQDPSLVVLTADLAGSTKTSVFAAAHPDRFYNMGVAEANMIGTAAGLAMSGFRPFVSTFAMFAPPELRMLEADDWSPASSTMTQSFTSCEYSASRLLGFPNG